jgi:hypothetical protein
VLRNSGNEEIARIVKSGLIERMRDLIWLRGSEGGKVHALANSFPVGVNVLIACIVRESGLHCCLLSELESSRLTGN